MNKLAEEYCTKTVHNPVLILLRVIAAFTSEVTFHKPAARVRSSSVSWCSATRSGMRSFRLLCQISQMGDGWMKSSPEPSPQSGRWERVSMLAAEAFSSKPWSHKVWLVGRGLVTRDTLPAASAMAFDLFMAAIPMLALAGWLFAALSRGSDAVLLSTSLMVD